MFPQPRVIEVDGRVLTVEDTGPHDGVPVLVHSGGGSRHIAPAAVRQAHVAGMRLIGYDRPAYGGSTPLPGRSVADCGPDVLAIATELELGRFGVWGFSGGGPYALATAALLPGMVGAVCLFAPLGPCGANGLDFLADMDDSYRDEVEMFFADRAAARETFRREAAELHARLSTPDAWLATWGTRAEQDAAHSREAAEYLAAVYWDGWTHADDGWWDDWTAFLHPWGFDLADVAAPVSLWHGLADTRCPPSHSRWLASRIPHVTTHFPADRDHTNIEDDYRGDGFGFVRGHIGRT